MRKAFERRGGVIHCMFHKSSVVLRSVEVYGCDFHGEAYKSRKKRILKE